MLPRPPRAMAELPSVQTGGLQRIRDKIYFLGPDDAPGVPPESVPEASSGHGCGPSR